MTFKKQMPIAATVVFVWALCAGFAPAFAADGGACKDDIQKFCGSVDASDHKAVHDCLKTNKDQLSDGCKAQMAKHHKKTSSTGSTTTGSTSGTAALAPAAGTNP